MIGGGDNGGEKMILVLFSPLAFFNDDGDGDGDGDGCLVLTSSSLQLPPLPLPLHLLVPL